MTNPLNPYSPPSEKEPDVPSVKQSSYGRILIQITRAIATITGIILGWLLIGQGVLQGTHSGKIVGVMIIGLSCMLGTGFRFRRIFRFRRPHDSP